MKTIIKLATAVSLGAALITGTAAAQVDREPVSSISQLLQRVRQDAQDAQAENQQRLQEFRQQRAQQQQLVSQARSRLNSLQAEADANRAQFEENAATISELDAQLREEQGAFGELFGVARQTAGEFASLIEASIVSAQYPSRHIPLETLAESRTLPGARDLQNIYNVMINEMNAQAEVVTFDRAVVGLNQGEPVATTRIGTFVIFAQDGGTKFLQWSTNEDDRTTGYVLSVLPAQPPGRLLSAASALANAEPNSISEGPFDPSRGQLLEIFKDVPSLPERFEQGGIVAKIIAGLFIFSALFGLWRLLALVMTGNAINAQKRKSTASKGNPLGRIMLAYEEVKDRPVETIELKLDEAILRETPKLELGLNFLKLAAGVAPLLGLLGTVTGMIRTFTQITLFGTGDPRIMAGGISEALVTTVSGLIAAIPLLFIHSFAASFARGAQQTLEEQAAGIVARHAEERGQA